MMAMRVAVPLVVTSVIRAFGRGSIAAMIAVAALFDTWWFFVYPSTVLSSAKKQTRKLYAEGKNLCSIGRRKMTLSPEYLTVQTDVGQGTTPWRGVEKILQTDDYIFIFLGAVNAHLVPRRCFPTVESFNAFFEAARSFHRNFAP
jgi:hypothetical protein